MQESKLPLGLYSLAFFSSPYTRSIGDKSGIIHAMSSDQKLQDLGEVHLCVEVYVRYQSKVLMHRRSKNKKYFPGYLIGPGGHLNTKENVVEAACREVEEETGIIVQPTSMKLKYVGIHHHIDTHTVWINWGYLSTPPDLAGRLKQSEEGISEWIDFDQLMKRKDDIFPPSLEYFDHLLHDLPGVLYTNSEWIDDHLQRTVSRTLVTA